MTDGLKPVKGTICAIVCPALVDELVYGILQDKDEKNLYVIESEYNSYLLKKLDSNGITYEMRSEYQLQNLLDIDDEKFNIVIIMNDLGLHVEPDDLRKFIENQIEELQDKFSAIMLYYGMCGNYSWDVSAWAKSNGFCPVTIFRGHSGVICDDCIGVAVGGSERYYELLKKYTGMMFITPCGATEWKEFLRSMSLFKGCDTSDRDMMKLLLEMAGYKYSVLLDTGLGDRENFRPCALEYSKAMGLEMIEASEGWATPELAVKLYEDTKNLLR